MAEVQDRERLEFEHKWEDTRRMKKYSKPSAGLLQLRRIQQKNALAKRFEDARQVKTIADRLQHADRVKAGGQAVLDLHRDHGFLAEKQAQDLEQMEIQFRIDECLATNARDAELKRLNSIIYQMERTRDRNRPLNLKPGVPPFTSNTRTRSVHMQQRAPPATPRSSQTLSEFKAEEPKRLPTLGLNVRGLMEGTGSRRPQSQLVISRLQTLE
jgi:hypothetical protein